MNSRAKLVGLFSLFLAAGAAHATPIVETVGFGSGQYMCPVVADPACNAGTGAASSVSWTHNTPAGFTVTSYIIELELYDDFVPFGSDPATDDRGEPEFGSFFQEGIESIPTLPTFEMRSPFEIDGIATSPQIFQFAGTAAGLAMLNGTGMLSVRLDAIFNPVPFAGQQGVHGDDFFLLNSRLIIEGQGPTPVPEPGTLLLIALGLLAIGLVRQKRLTR
ncbi:MAG: PEP-CTERM sorting domain-containing protein [Pseudomonadota bacterium]